MIKLHIFRTKTYDDPIKHIEYLHKLIWLVAQDVIFFGFPTRDGGISPALMCNDTFGYACADAEDFSEEDIDIIIEAYQKFDYDGIIAWSSFHRKQEPLKELQTDRYNEALNWVKEQYIKDIEYK